MGSMCVSLCRCYVLVSVVHQLLFCVRYFELYVVC